MTGALRNTAGILVNKRSTRMTSKVLLAQKADQAKALMLKRTK